MSLLRQLGTGILYAVISIVLVVGGLSLALAESGGTVPAPPPTSTATAGESQPLPSLTAAVTVVTETATSIPSPVVFTATPQFLVQTATPLRAAATNTTRPLPTATRQHYATPIACGPYSGWVKAYTVQQGDTLFHIATLYRTTYTALQIANCKSNTLIFAGERLWVPNVATATPGITLIPTFPTSTPFPTEPLTLTPVPPVFFTETAAPTPTTDPGP